MIKSRYFFFSFFFLVTVAWMGCGRGCTTEKEIERSSEWRTVGKHKVHITAVKYEQTTTFLRGLFTRRNGRVNQRRSYYVAFNIKVDNRPELEHANVTFLDSENDVSTDDLLAKFKIRFARSDEHFESSVDGISLTYHMLKEGSPFALAYTNNDADPYSDAGLNQLPSAYAMLDSLIVLEREQYIEPSSTDNIVEVLSQQKSPSHYDFLLLEHICQSFIGDRVLNEMRMKKCLRNEKWKKRAENICADTNQVTHCGGRYFKLISVAADPGMLDFYDREFGFSDLEDAYIDVRLKSGRNVKAFKKGLVVSLRKSIAPAVDSGFAYWQGVNAIVFKYVPVLDDRGLSEDLFKAIIHTENFDDITFRMREVYEFYPGAKQRAIREAALASLLREPERRWSTWSFLQEHETCERLRSILKAHPELRQKYSLPYRCERGRR